MSQLRTVASVCALVRRCVCAYVCMCLYNRNFSFDHNLSSPVQVGDLQEAAGEVTSCPLWPATGQDSAGENVNHSLMLGRIPISRTRTNHLTVFTVEGILQLYTSQAEATPTACHNQDWQVTSYLVYVCVCLLLATAVMRLKSIWDFHLNLLTSHAHSRGAAWGLFNIKHQQQLLSGRR